jgi:putative flippase GtrA
MLKPELAAKIARFAAVGCVVMAVFMGLNWLLGMKLGRLAAFLIAYPPALALHFCLNKWWTFGCQRTDNRRQVGEYLLMAAGTFFLQLAVFRALSAWTPFPGWLAAGAANAAQMAVTFLVMQRRIFAEGSTGS